jgi:uncharacterized protein (DUF885 family)
MKSGFTYKRSLGFGTFRLGSLLQGTSGLPHSPLSGKPPLGASSARIPAALHAAHRRVAFRWLAGGSRLAVLIAFWLSSIAMFGSGSPVLAGLTPEAVSERASHASSELPLYAMADAYFDELLALNPSWSTSLGLHEHDLELEDYSRAGREKETVLLKKYLTMFEAVDSSGFSLTAKDDLELLKNDIQAKLLSLQTVKKWQRDPDFYTSAISETLFPLIKRNFAPMNERLKAVIAREKKMPAVLEEGKLNIDRQAVPRIFAEVAEEQLPGIIDFFQRDVPEGIKSATDIHLKEEFARSNAAVITSLKSYKQYVHELLADKQACQGDFALGAATYAKKLSYEEMVDEPLDLLLEKGEKELTRLQKEFNKTASEIDAKAAPLALFETISQDHPTADKLISAVKDMLEQLRTFCIDKHIVDIPSGERIGVDEMPPFMRATTFAAMDAPGPFEQKAKEAFYFVTLPESTWSKEKVEEHLRAFSYDDLINTNAHEAYPGHFVQSLWTRTLSSKVRKILGCGSNNEGWAHYCEEMMWEQGSGKGDKKVRLVELQLALMRACRYVVGIRMHTKGMTLPEACDFFVKQGYMDKANAEREAKRGTGDPTYLVYTLGKLQILSLRDEMKKIEGDKFNLYDFHNRFLKAGSPPVAMVRKEMLADLSNAN